MWADRFFFALWMGFLALAYGFVSVLTLSKALQGEISFREAGITVGPLAFSFLGVWAGGGSLISWVFGLAGLGYLCWITFQRHHEEKRVEQELIDRDLEKWSRAVADDDLNAGAHLFLGNALAQRGDFDAAATHYRRSLELDPRNARDLMRFLGQHDSQAEAAVRSRLPELDRIVQEQRERDTYGRVVSGPNAQPPPPVPLVAEEAEASAPGAPETVTAEASQEAPSERQFFGYASEEERYKDQERHARLSEMRRVLDTAPDDLATRFAYAAALEESGHLDRAVEEYRHILALSPGNADAAAAVARLEASGAVPPEGGSTRPTQPGSSGQRRLAQLSRLKEVLSVGEGDVDARLAYARSLEEGEMTADAIEQYERVLAQDPGNKEAAAALARLGKPAAPDLDLHLSVESFAPPRSRPQERA